MLQFASIFKLEIQLALQLQLKVTKKESITFAAYALPPRDICYDKVISTFAIKSVDHLFDLT